MMVEYGTIKTLNSTDLLLKNVLVMSVSALTFFCVGYGFSAHADGGLYGQEHFFAFNM
jgi:ammonia channel protein AmtB